MFTQVLLELLRLPADVIQERLVLHGLPHSLDLLLGGRAQGPLPDGSHRLPQLLEARGSDDDGVAFRSVKDRVVEHPAEGQLGRRDALRRRDLVPRAQRAPDRGPLNVQALIELADEVLRVPPPLALLDLLLGLGQEAPRDWAVRVEGD